MHRRRIGPLAVVTTVLAVALGGTGALTLLGDPTNVDGRVSAGPGTAHQAPASPLPTGSASTSASATASTSPSASKTTSKPKPTTGTRTQEASTPEAEVLRLVNVERARLDNCPALRNDTRLARAARDHSKDMAAHNYFGHVSQDGRTFVDRIEDAGYPRNQAAAENIAAGYGSPAAVMNGWMLSEGHKRNILNCGFRALGVGLAYSPGGMPYWTQNFGRQ